MISNDIITNTVAMALREDLGSGDITAALIPEENHSVARVISNDAAVICGQRLVNEVFAQVDASLNVSWQVKDGQKVSAKTCLFTVSGVSRSLLSAERTALNLLQMLSGTATSVHEYVQKLSGTKAKLLDTRKTIPGFRLLQKYAVTCGGGHNHRLGLFDAYLIKENHIKACGSIAKAVQKARALSSLPVEVEVEVENFAELQEAIGAKADIVMLDNFTLSAIKKAVALVKGCLKLEVSGNVELANLQSIAKTGVDYISVGALTKHIKAIDLSMRFVDV